MPRKPRQTPPSYCLHKASGRAVVRIDGKDHYLGPHGSPESHAEYARVIAEWRVKQADHEEKRQAVVREAGYSLTISQVLYRYRDFARGYYVKKNGEPSKEFAEMRYALRPLRQLYGDTLARDFGPLKLKAVRQHLIDQEKLSRGVINNRTKRIKRFFKWAVNEELVPPSVAHGLAAVGGLRRGRTIAREAPPVKPVPDAWIEAVLPYLSPPVAAMVRLHRLTGMRPCEVVLVRACDIDMSGEIWIYEPEEHKNQWRGHRRTIPIGPQGQTIIKPLIPQAADRYLFSPRDAELWRNEQRGQRRDPNRKTKIYPCELRARARRKAAAKHRDSKRPKRERYDVDSYRRAISYAIAKANKHRDENNQIPHWSPLQIRHTRATEIRKDFGIEAAQVSLGHAQADVTQVYAERNLRLAIEVAKKTG